MRFGRGRFAIRLSRAAPRPPRARAGGRTCKDAADPVDLLGAIYIIEGAGQRIIPALLPLVKEQLDLPPRVFRFLAYHGENDARHVARWLDAVGSVVEREGGNAYAEAIVASARNTAQLYLMQLEGVV
jgi:3-oxoacyl-[acyl-carrier-protein] synthase-3